jgi:hypothetical protein
MAHHALRNPIPWSSRLILNGEELLNNNGWSECGAEFSPHHM